MNKIPTVDGKFSYYLKPIGNIDPYDSVNLERTYNLISRGKLSPLTLQIRSGKGLKTKILPYITASGVFEKRSMDKLISYSGIVSIDLDNVDTDIRKKLFGDQFLNPGLLFVSPSGKGIKMFVRVSDAAAFRHDQYFNAITMYLYNTYVLNSDPACRDISRACFLCHDAEALFSTCGSVSSSALIDLIPLMPLIPLSSAGPQIVAHIRPKKPLPCDKLPIMQHSDHVSQLCAKLNACSAVYNYACSLLKINGWSQKNFYWFRPGKELNDGHSAVFTFYSPYGIYLFTNYSSSSPHFTINKSYTLCSLLSIIGYNSDFARCTADLHSLFQNHIEYDN